MVSLVDQREYQTTLWDTTTNKKLGTVTWYISSVIGLSKTSGNVFINATIPPTVLWNGQPLSEKNIIRATN